MGKGLCNNNSAITGDIEYGFSHTIETASDRYAMTITSPESPTEIDYASLANEDYILSYCDDVEEPALQLHEPTVLPERTSSIVPLKLSQSTPTERNYRTQFQEKGLKLDTKPSQHIPPSAKSATVPSLDWKHQNPENSPVSEMPKIKRSATTGKRAVTKRRNYNLDPEAAAAFSTLKINANH